jgi:hypothetical protein
MVAAAIRQAFLQPDAEAARQTWRHVADQLRPRWPKLATLMDDSEHDVLAYLAWISHPVGDWKGDRGRLHAEAVMTKGHNLRGSSRGWWWCSDWRCRI